jgi:hypothetical protein
MANCTTAARFTLLIDAVSLNATPINTASINTLSINTAPIHRAPINTARGRRFRAPRLALQRSMIRSPVLAHARHRTSRRVTAAGATPSDHSSG